jgi:hypothetical protein
MSYDQRDIEVLKTFFKYDPFDVHTWPYFPIEMPLKEGQGPATHAECDQITYEVWDYFYNSHGSFKHLPDAINEAMRLSKEILG